MEPLQYTNNLRTTLAESRRLDQILNVLEDATERTIGIDRKLPLWEQRERHRRIHATMAIRIRDIDPAFFAKNFPDWNLQGPRQRSARRAGNRN